MYVWIGTGFVIEICSGEWLTEDSVDEVHGGIADETLSVSEAHVRGRRSVCPDRAL